MKRTSLFIYSTQQKALETLKVRDGTPVAESIRRAIDVYLTERGVDQKGRKSKPKG
jgi:Mg-chelatase subunit ChlD